MYVDPKLTSRKVIRKRIREGTPKRLPHGWDFWYNQDHEGWGKAFELAREADALWALGCGRIYLRSGWWTWELTFTKDGVLEKEGELV